MASEKYNQVVEAKALNVEFFPPRFLKTGTAQMENICLKQLITGNNSRIESDAIFFVENFWQNRFCYFNNGIIFRLINFNGKNCLN